MPPPVYSTVPESGSFVNVNTCAAAPSKRNVALFENSPPTVRSLSATSSVPPVIIRSLSTVRALSIVNVPEPEIFRSQYVSPVISSAYAAAPVYSTDPLFVSLANPVRVSAPSSFNVPSFVKLPVRSRSYPPRFNVPLNISRLPPTTIFANVVNVFVPLPEFIFRWLYLSP